MASIIKVDTIQTAAGGTPTAADLGINTTGTVLQVVSVSTSTQVQTSSSSDSDTGLTASITPSSTSSKIVIIATVMGCYRHNTAGSTRIHLRLKRNGATINDSGGNFAVNSTAVPMRGEISMSNVDSPNSTSAVEYKIAVSSDEGLSYVAVQKDGNAGTSTMTLLEIAG